MDNLFKCICEFGDNHYWLRSFFKQVIFFLKRILANRVLYDKSHINFNDDVIKNAVWKEISYDYKGQFTRSDSSDADCEDGCCLKIGQKVAQHQLARIIKSLRTGSESIELNKMDFVGSLEQAEVTDDGLIDVLHVAAFLLECIVANPVLYDRKNERHHDEMFKLKVWNEICRVFHDKVQNDELEVGDEDPGFEIKHVQKTIERHLHRMVEPLNMRRKASKAELSRMAIDLDSSSDAEYKDNESVDRGPFKKSRQPVTINIAPSKTGSQTVNIILNDGSVLKKVDDNSAIESKSDRGYSQIVDQLTAVERHSTPIKRAESTSSQGDRTQQRKYGAEKDRNPETSKRKKSVHENEREQKHSSDDELSHEEEQRKRQKSNGTPSPERSIRMKSVIQKKDASSGTSDTHKKHNPRK